MNITKNLPSIEIAGITEPVVLRYFQTFNAGDFQQTAALFAENGEMRPPFESAIVGQEAIATFLEAEAKGMQAHPREGIIEPLEGDKMQVQVSGKVQTPMFGVNVSWIFIVSQGEILFTTIKLLASPQELLSLKK